MKPPMPLSDRCWRLITTRSGKVQGLSFWMSARTYAAMSAERPGRRPMQIYAVRVQLDQSMAYGVIALEQRAER